MMLFYHLNHDCQSDDERRIYSLSNIDGITIAKQRKLAANLGKQIAIVVADSEIPAPDVTIDVKDHAIVAFHFKAFTEKTELLMYTGPMLVIAVDFIARKQRENALLDMYQGLARKAIIHDQVITNMKEFPFDIKNHLSCLITHHKR